EPQSLQSLVLNEAISTLPKLTHGQVDILTMIWYMTQTIEPKVKDLASLSQEWCRSLGPVISGLSVSRADFNHLLYAGCIRYYIGENKVWDFAMKNYGQYLSNGVTRESLAHSSLSTYCDDERVFKSCDNFPDRKRAAQEYEMIKEGNSNLFPSGSSESRELEALRLGSYPTQDELLEQMTVNFPAFPDFCRLWDDSQMKSSDLSTVGLAIAHSNSSRIHGPEENPGLEVWLNDDH
ncbi:MAG: hypothetical protein JWN41_1731, partial [Thermoleophilia bacterium]|nr:hypothetical protein [Thermoleophilia bacterium]